MTMPYVLLSNEQLPGENALPSQSRNIYFIEILFKIYGSYKVINNQSKKITDSYLT